MNSQLGKELLYIARSAIARELGLPTAASRTRSAAVEQALQTPGAVFVTLTRQGELRGCVGSLRPVRALVADCAENAVAAAFADNRFPPLRDTEFDQVRIEVSLLGEIHPFACESEQDACERLRPGVDGVILDYRGHRATFLPQVWEQLPDPREFLYALKRKAGLDPHLWNPEVELAVYEVSHWSENEQAEKDAA